MLICDYRFVNNTVKLLESAVDNIGCKAGVDASESNHLLGYVSITSGAFYSDGIVRRVIGSIGSKGFISASSFSQRIPVGLRFSQRIPVGLRLVVHGRSDSIGVKNDKISVLITTKREISNVSNVLIIKNFEVIKISNCDLISLDCD